MKVYGITGGAGTGKSEVIKMLQQNTRRTRVLRQYQIGFLQYTQSTICNIFQVPHRSRYQI